MKSYRRRALYEEGLETRREVLGDEYVERSLSQMTEFDREFQELLTEYCWGVAWGDNSLSRQQRSLNTLCLLAAMNRSHEFETHLKGAIRNGCSIEEIRATLVQIAVYAGVPAGVEAFRIAKQVL